VLVNNAGTVLSESGIWTSAQSALRQMDVIFMGAVRMTSAVPLKQTVAGQKTAGYVSSPDLRRSAICMAEPQSADSRR
jgi:NAD(P)-dependent dehydrogenase (short-subunit alcohol dehydrogenase family)